jgi:exopolysaccharide production protein ExoQ
MPRPELRLAASLAWAAAIAIGVALPLLMAPATKSSPVVLGAAAALALASCLTGGSAALLRATVARTLASPFAIAALVLVAFMGASIPFAHAPAASANQYVQLLSVLGAGAVLAAVFPLVAPPQRAILFTFGAVLTAAVIFIDLKSGLWLRNLTGGRTMTYSYNRGLVTLAILIWPLLALIVASRKLWLIPPLLLIPLAVNEGDSGTAVMALVAGVAVFPVAALLPRFTWVAGLSGTLLLLAVQPWFGSLMQQVISQSIHGRFSGAHSGDRVDIWLSFEAAARAKWLFGNGFGSSLNMQKAPVAALVPPDRVTLLGASHPHNGLLQLWVEMGVIGASLAAVLILLAFRAVAAMRPGLQPFALVFIAVVTLVTLVSHGAWQAWWWATILAGVAAFATLERELRRGSPPA